VEVLMRPPEVFVGPLAHEEAVALKRRAKSAKHFSSRQRVAILLASNVGNSVPQIAAMWMTDESHVRKVIHDFNERGMASLDPEYRGGRPRRITDEDRRAVVAVAGARPDQEGYASPTRARDRIERGDHGTGPPSDPVAGEDSQRKDRLEHPEADQDPAPRVEGAGDVASALAACRRWRVACPRRADVVIPTICPRL
jgi:hypothetical protein